MTVEQFCYWLSGYIQFVPSGKGVSPNQLKVIRGHLAGIIPSPVPSPVCSIPDQSIGSGSLPNKQYLDILMGKTIPTWPPSPLPTMPFKKY